MWKTGDPAYDPKVKHALGLSEHDAIVGFIYLGTPATPRGPLPPPDLASHVTHWAGIGNAAAGEVER
jgi:hypothetical protein